MSSQIQKSTDFADKQLTAMKQSETQIISTSKDSVRNRDGVKERTIPCLRNILIDSNQQISQKQTCILSQILHSYKSIKIASQSPHQSFQNQNNEQEQILPLLGGRLISTDEDTTGQIYRQPLKDKNAKCSEISQQTEYQFSNDIKVSQILHRKTIQKVQADDENPGNDSAKMRKKIKALQSKLQSLQQKVSTLEQRVSCLQLQKKQTQISHDITLQKMMEEKNQNSMIIEKYERRVKQLQEQNSILKINSENNSVLDQSFPFVSQLNQKSRSLFIKKLSNQAHLNKSSPNIPIQKQDPRLHQKMLKKQYNQHSVAALVRILKQLKRLKLNQIQKKDFKARIAILFA